MAKEFVVVFNDRGARIYKGAEALNRYLGDPNVLFNPELPAGIPPHRWRLGDGKIIVVDEPIEVPVTPMASMVRRLPLEFLPYLLSFGVGLALGLLF